MHKTTMVGRPAKRAGGWSFGDKAVTVTEGTEEIASRIKVMSGNADIDRREGPQVRECPVCHARCFDDIEVCYGCLHAFVDDQQTSTEDPKPVIQSDGLSSESLEPVLPAAEVEAPVAVPALITGSTDTKECPEKKTAPVQSVGTGAAEKAGDEVTFVKLLDLVIGVRIAQDAHGRELAVKAGPQGRVED